MPCGGRQEGRGSGLGPRGDSSRPEGRPSPFHTPLLPSVTSHGRHQPSTELCLSHIFCGAIPHVPASLGVAPLAGNSRQALWPTVGWGAVESAQGRVDTEPGRWVARPAPPQVPRRLWCSAVPPACVPACARYRPSPLTHAPGSAAGSRPPPRSRRSAGSERAGQAVGQRAGWPTPAPSQEGHGPRVTPQAQKCLSEWGGGGPHRSQRWSGQGSPTPGAQGAPPPATPHWTARHHLQEVPRPGDACGCRLWSARPHLGDLDHGLAELLYLILTVPDAPEVLVSPVFKEEPRYWGDRPAQAL